MIEENKLYSNLPTTATVENRDSAAPTAKYFSQYYNSPLDIDNNSVQAIQAFFEKRGFTSESAEATAIIIVSQATRDKIPAGRIIDTLGGLDNIELSGLLTEILNYHRFKTSSLGIYVAPVAADEVQRNILA